MDIAGIGRLKVISKDYILPSLHFIVHEKNDGFEATCLEFVLSSYGKTDKESISNLVRLTSAFITEMMKLGKKGKENMMSLIQDTFTNDLWKDYRTVNFNLAFNGVSTERDDKLLEEIEALRKLVLSSKSASPFEIEPEYKKAS